MKKNLPELNSRIDGLMDELTEGNVVKLTWLLSQKAPQFKISQQKLNRIFIPDPRTKKIPSVPSDILMALALSTNVNADWLLTGRGEMLLSSPNDQSKKLEAGVSSEDLRKQLPED